ncbi:proteoglycan 4 [Hyposmocoma kahamanoa]|uniref:proteoglycan 4 n=1 Tax=Hyposmocoma kahamanoa TaxID=1477025 RepID=UPI000E6D75B5|nr:proteoglycan 4 [Hyposmocoma kahamanoa]
MLYYNTEKERHFGPLTPNVSLAEHQTEFPRIRYPRPSLNREVQWLLPQDPLADLMARSAATPNAHPRGLSEENMLKSELIPRGSKLDSLSRAGPGTREYHYEYKEEKHPTGKYDRKDLHTVEEYTIPKKSTPKNSESNSYYYEREERELPSFGTTGTRTYNYETTSSSTPGYSKIKSSKATKELSQNVEELDSLLDDLQKDQERQLYKSGYTSDTAESSSFDYKRGTPIKAPSSGYSTLKREERVETSSWGSSPPPTVTRAAELRQEMYREEKTESRVVPAPVTTTTLQLPSTTTCHHCHQNTGTLSRSSTPMNKVTTTVKTYTYEVPADQDPTTVPLPPLADHEHTYVSSHENLRSTTNTSKIPPSPSPGGCQYCSHCNSRIREYRHVTTTDSDHTNERIIYPKPANETKLIPVNDSLNGHGPHGPTSYKYSETTYSSQNTTERYPPAGAPFPRPTTPSPSTQQPPKKLDDLLADFPEARFPTQPDGLSQRSHRVEVSHERAANSAPKPAPATPTRNAAGPAVYYPPGHVPFQKKEAAGYQASAMQGGGAYASGRGMYEYESGSKSKEKHSEKKTAVPLCLPLCCAMPCVIL